MKFAYIVNGRKSVFAACFGAGTSAEWLSMTEVKSGYVHKCGKLHLLHFFFAFLW